MAPLDPVGSKAQQDLDEFHDDISKGDDASAFHLLMGIKDPEELGAVMQALTGQFAGSPYNAQADDPHDLENFVLNDGPLKANDRKDLTDLFNLFAKTLDGATLAKVSDTFARKDNEQDHRDDVIALSQALVNQCPSTAEDQEKLLQRRVDFIRNMAGYTDNGSDSGGNWNMIHSSPQDSDPDAIAVGNVLASLSGFPQQINQAVNSLNPSQLQKVMDAAANIRQDSFLEQKSDITGDPYKSFSSDATSLCSILSAVAGPGVDPDVKAKAFVAGTAALNDIRSTNQPDAPLNEVPTANSNADSDARRVEAQLTAILDSNTTGVVRALADASGPPPSGNALDPHGDALSKYISELFYEEPGAATKEIYKLMARMQQGNDMAQKPQDYLDGTKTGSYLPLRDLGYFTGAAKNGINDGIDQRVKEKIDTLDGINKTVTTAGAAISFPEGAVGRVAGALFAGALQVAFERGGASIDAHSEADKEKYSKDVGDAAWENIRYYFQGDPTNPEGQFRNGIDDTT